MQALSVRKFCLVVDGEETYLQAEVEPLLLLQDDQVAGNVK